MVTMLYNWFGEKKDKHTTAALKGHFKKIEDFS